MICGGKKSNILRTGNGEGHRIGHDTRSVPYLTSIISVVRRTDVVYRQDAAVHRKVVYLYARPLALLPAQLALVLGPGNVQRLVALAARAHQLGAHSLRDVAFKTERRYSRRD